MQSLKKRRTMFFLLQGSLDQFLIKKFIKQQQPESVVDADALQTSTSAM